MGSVIRIASPSGLYETCPVSTVQRLPVKAGIAPWLGMGWFGLCELIIILDLSHSWSMLLARRLLSLVATMDPPQTTLCHRPSLLIVHPGVRIIGQHCAAIMPQEQGGTNYWRRTLYQSVRCWGAFVRELILNRSFDVSMLQSRNYFSQKFDLY